MRHIALVGILIALGSAVGCTRTPEPVSNSRTPQPPTPEVRMVEPVANISLPPATANKTAPGTTIAERANRQPRIDSGTGAAPGPLQFKPAGENSEIAVTMESDGTVREVRIFKSHPQLAKVESSFRDPGERTLKFTMRNGKVATVKTSRIKDLQTATAAELLALAGR